MAPLAFRLHFERSQAPAARSATMSAVGVATSSDGPRAARAGAASCSSESMRTNDQPQRPPRHVDASGQGCRPRIWLWIACAGRAQSIWLSSVVEPGRVGAELFVLRLFGDRARREPVERRRPAARRRARRGRVRARRSSRPGRSASTTRASIGPASSAMTTRMIVTPVSVSPAMIARWIGAAPRQRGSSDACTLIMPSRGRSSSALRQDLAVGRDHAEVGAERASGSRNASSLQAFGLQDGQPRVDGARALTGAAVTFWPRPRGRSGCVTTPTTWWRRASSARASAPRTAGVPKKTTRSGVTTCRRAASFGSCGRSGRA